MADQVRAKRNRALMLKARMTPRDRVVLDCFAMKMKTEDILAKLANEFGIKLSLATLYNIRKRAINAAAAETNELGDNLRFEELRHLELIRAKLMRQAFGLDNAAQMAAINGEETSPSLPHMDRLLKVSESIRKLQGMDAPTKTDNKISGNLGVDINYDIILGDLTKQVNRWTPPKTTEEVLKELGMLDKGSEDGDESPGEEGSSSTPTNA